MLKGFTCPPQVPTAGTRNELSWCLSSCPHPCVAPPLLLAIYEAEQSNYHQGAYISASMLSGASCARQTWFERKEDVWDHPLKRYWSFRGTHAHSMIEAGAAKLAPHGWIQELHMSVPLTYENECAPIFDAQGAFTGKFDTDKPLVIDIGGTCDAFKPGKKPYPMWDFKSMADAKADMFVRGEKGGKFSPNLEDRWVWQLNIYRWLVSQTAISPAIKKQYKLKGKFFPAPEFIGIQGISMMEIPRSGMPYKLRGSKEHIRDIDDVPLLPLEDVEAFVREKAIIWYHWLVLGEKPPVVEDAMSWICKNCPFNGEVISGERCFPRRERQAARSPSNDELLFE